MRTIRDCPCAVIGGAGFLGSHLVDHLIEDRGCDVLVVDNLISGRREFVHRLARFEHADITASESHLKRLFREHRTRFVFNYAAWPYVPTSYARPLAVFDVNAMGALQVINAAQEAGCEAILQISSAELFGQDNRRSDGRLKETDPVEPHSSYGAAKAAIDALVQVRWREAGTPVIALRQFNCVGERETHPYVVPEIISQLAKIKEAQTDKDWKFLGLEGLMPAVRLGNNSSRDFLYAGDQVKIATELLERGQFGEVYNLGSEEGIRIYDLAKLIGRVMGFADVRVEEDEARKRRWEIWSLLADNSKIRRTIHTWPRLVSLEEALRLTVAWYEGNGRRWPWER